MFAVKKVGAILIMAGLLLSACGGAGKQEVKVTLTEFGIESSLTDFKVGVPYQFVVTNTGSVNHEFMIGHQLAADHMSKGMSMEELDKMALAMIAESKLTPGASVTIDYTFQEPAAAGNLEFACHTPGHYEAGMQLPVTVK